MFYYDTTSAAGGRCSELIYCAAVDKIEEKRKPEDFIGHRKRDHLKSHGVGFHNQRALDERQI